MQARRSRTVLRFDLSLAASMASQPEDLVITPKKTRSKRARSKVEDLNHDLDERDIAEINVFLRADRRKISKTLRLVRGDDLITDGTAAAESVAQDVMPATYCRFALVPKKVLMAAIVRMDKRFTVRLLESWNKCMRGLIWCIFTFMTGIQKEFPLPPFMRNKDVFIDVCAKYADHLGFKVGLPSPDVKSGDYYRVCCFKLFPETSDDRTVVHHTHVRFCIGAEVPLPSTVDVTSEWQVDNNDSLMSATVSQGSVTLRFVTLFPHLEAAVQQLNFLDFANRAVPNQNAALVAVQPSVVLYCVCRPVP